MIAYFDSSVLLRVVLGQKNQLDQWQAIETGVASALVEVECLRTIDPWLWQRAPAACGRSGSDTRV